jgi:hypothetical protein
MLGEREEKPSLLASHFEMVISWRGKQVLVDFRLCQKICSPEQAIERGDVTNISNGTKKHPVVSDAWHSAQ